MRPYYHHRSWYEEYGEGSFSCSFCKGTVELVWNREKRRFVTKYKAVIHHIDGDHGNNNVKNLQVMHYGCHSKHHNVGSKRTKASRKTMSKARIGMKFSDEHRANISKVKTGTVASEETKAKMRKSQKARRKKERIRT